MRKKVFLAVWIVGMLFPTAWASQFLPVTVSLFSRVFAQDWVHILAHAILFGVLGGIIYAWIAPTLEHPIDGRQALQKILPVILLIVGIAVLQESIQVIALDADFYKDEWFDLRVDLIAGLTGMGLSALWLQYRSRMSARMINKTKGINIP